MRPRSLSVAYDRTDQMFKKFEGVVASDNEELSDSDAENVEPLQEEKVDWVKEEYDTLLSQIRKILPKHDNRKAQQRLKTIEWEKVAFGGHSASEVEKVTTDLLKSVRKYRNLSEMLDDLGTAIMKNITAGKPKNPISAYNFFIKERMTTFKADHPGISTGHALRHLAEQFKALPSKKKRKYEKLAEDNKAEYQIALKKYYEQNPEAAKFAPKPKKLSDTVKGPKATTPYSIFADEKRSEGLKLSKADMLKLWNNIDFDKKMKYIRAAYSSEKSKLTKEEKAILDVAEGKPEYVPRTLQEYYIKKYYDKDPGTDVKDWRKAAAAAFKKLPKVKKLELELELRRAQTAYIRKYQDFMDQFPNKIQKDEIVFLRQYMESTMDKNAGADCFTLPNELTDVPVAESTTNDIGVPKKKANKKTLLQNATTVSSITSPLRTLKSILKSPAPKRALVETEPSTPSPSKKKKSAPTISIDSESDNNAVTIKEKKKAKKDKNIVDSDVNSSDATKSNGNIAMKEPKRPTKNIHKYYRKHHYFGKDGKHVESFEKLSARRKKIIEEEMRAAQKKYMTDLKAYLDVLPKPQVKAYVAQLKEFANQSSADERESEEESVAKSTTFNKNVTKNEPTTSSEEDDV